jgi:hypothetical protein
MFFERSYKWIDIAEQREASLQESNSLFPVEQVELILFPEFVGFVRDEKE